MVYCLVPHKVESDSDTESLPGALALYCVDKDALR